MVDLLGRIQREYQHLRSKFINEQEIAGVQGNAVLDLDSTEKLQRVVELLARKMTSGSSFIQYLRANHADSVEYYMGNRIFESIMNITTSNKERLLEIAEYGLFLQKTDESVGGKEVGKLIYNLAAAKAFELGVYKQLAGKSSGVIDNVIEKHSDATWKRHFTRAMHDRYTLPIFREMLQRGYDSVEGQGYVRKVEIKVAQK